MTGTVVRYAPYGFFVKIDGNVFDGLVQITDFKDEGRMHVDECLPIGCQIKAVILGFKESGKQIWMGVKPSQVGIAH